ncbi:hypothetical protein ACNFJ7_12385 [Sphingomonas sp. HT-1]|uniref:hypothetical protein n=1 Tax=unclassified Sphingomonas TaxID=196159 RepID=UPI0002F96CF4|nr:MULTISPECIES: hypothetical protein [unclassified Sphingomonas]KTF68199.1 hypothetical protein ATB93_01710 [Sphingomonas sp. WG]
MKLLVACALATAVSSPAAMAQQTPPAAAPAPAQAATPASAAKFSLDTPIEQLIADPKAKAVLDADLPGVSTHPALDQFKTMSLRAVQPFSNGALTDEMLAKVEKDLAAIQ